MPPDAAFRGDAWRDEWRARLEATPPWLFAWLRQQRDGPYWRQGSLAPDYDAIEAAILNFGGWMDSYVDAAFRMQARCTAPRARSSATGSTAGRRRRDPGPEPRRAPRARPVLRPLAARASPTAGTTSRRSSGSSATTPPPEPFPGGLPGRWRAAAAYPASGGRGARVAVRRRRPAAGGRARRPTDATATPAARRRSTAIAHRPTTGTRAALSWGAGGPPNGLARDLRPDEALGPTYTSAPLDDAGRDPRRARGRPPPGGLGAGRDRRRPACGRRARTGPRPRSAPAILNLTHRRSHAEPEPLDPGGSRRSAIPLRPAGYRFAPGHRIRVSVASSAWPVIWPSPFPADVRAPSRSGDAVAPRPAGRAAGRRPGRRAGPGVQDDAAGRCREVGGEGSGRRTGLADHGGRHRRDRDGHDPRRRRGHPRRWPPAVRGRDADA